MVFCLGTEGIKSSLIRNGWFQCFSVKEVKVPKVPYLKIVVPMVFCLGTESIKSSLFKNWVVPMFFCLGTQGSEGSLLRNGWFQWFSV